MKSTHVQGGICIKWKEKVLLLERLVFGEQLMALYHLPVQTGPFKTMNKEFWDERAEESE